MKSFWVTPAHGSDCLPLVGKVQIAAGDENGALFSGVFEEPMSGAKTLIGYLQFPERTQESMFRGSLTTLKELCLDLPSGHAVIRDPRWDHLT